jgi:hypothetical protein
MKSLKLFPLAVCGVIIGFILLGISVRNRQPAQIFPATIERDCAPWDGTAFTVSIRYDPTTTITISIWRSPDIKYPVTFIFPDDSGQGGTAYILPELDPLQPLSGRVSFWRVDGASPVEGAFDLLTDAGRRLKGKFVAEWGNEIVYCG